MIIATLEKTQEIIADNLYGLGFEDVYGICDELSRELRKEVIEQFQDKEIIYR